MSDFFLQEINRVTIRDKNRRQVLFLLGDNRAFCSNPGHTNIYWASSCLEAYSTLAITSLAGMYVGVTAKFSPFFSRAISASSRDLKDKLIAQLLRRII